MNRSYVIQQWFATPDSRITEMIYPLAVDSGMVRITGKSTPPSKMSDMASETRNPFVKVRRDLLATTNRHMVTLASTTKTDKTVITTFTIELSDISLSVNDTQHL